MCCPKGKCGCQYFILLTLKTNFMDTGVLDFFNQKTNPGLLFLLNARSCVFISNVQAKIIIETTFYMIPTKNLIETKLYINPTKI
jgi:hypothetical protein